MIADVDRERLDAVATGISGAGGRADAIAFDLLDPTAGAEAVADVVDRHGRLDVLVNNAGVMRRGPADDRPRGLGAVVPGQPRRDVPPE